MRNLCATAQPNDVAERPTSGGVLSPEDKALRFVAGPYRGGLGPGLIVMLRVCPRPARTRPDGRIPPSWDKAGITAWRAAGRQTADDSLRGPALRRVPRLLPKYSRPATVPRAS